MERILENWSRFLTEEKKPSTIEKEKQRKKRKKAFQGLDDLQKDLLEKKKTGPGCEDPANPFHGEDGRFTDPDDEPKGSWSCPEKPKKKARRGRSLRFTKNPCGRGSRYRCKDGSAKWEESMDKGRIDPETIRQAIRAELEEVLRAYEDFLDDQEQLLEQGSEEEMMKWCRRRGLLSLQRFLQIQDAFERSAKGALNKKD